MFKLCLILVKVILQLQTHYELMTVIGFVSTLQGKLIRDYLCRQVEITFVICRRGESASLTVESPTQSRTAMHSSEDTSAVMLFQPGASIVLGQVSFNQW